MNFLHYNPSEGIDSLHYYVLLSGFCLLEEKIKWYCNFGHSINHGENPLWVDSIFKAVKFSRWISSLWFILVEFVAADVRCHWFYMELLDFENRQHRWEVIISVFFQSYQRVNKQWILCVWSVVAHIWTPSDVGTCTSFLRQRLMAITWSECLIINVINYRWIWFWNAHITSYVDCRYINGFHLQNAKCRARRKDSGLGIV